MTARGWKGLDGRQGDRGTVRRRSPVRLAAALAWVAVLALTGCVTRTMTIETDPPGAEVFAGGEYLGSSPVTRPFVFYGTQDIVLRKKGYEVKTVPMKLRPPFYQRFPIDFVPEVLYPGQIRDDQKFAYVLEASSTQAPADLVERAREVRQRLDSVPLETSQKRAKKKKTGHGTFPYPARSRHWWHRR
ncbi:MAG: PEGA domain-containing protein [Planctomycetes bacterium]|nr:PEGA domain-containing protein [Planctomycetota bacterium]